MLLQYSKTYKPFKYPWAMELAEKHEKIHWIHQEVDFASDVKDWQKNLTESEKNLVHQVFKLFTQSDVQVGENYIDNLLAKFKNNEIRNMLLSFAAREGIHQRAYAALIETLNLPDSDFEAFLDYTQMVNKIEFMKDNDTSTQTGTALSLVKNIFSEGVSLFGSFVMLLNFQRHGKMLGMNTIIRWSILDEALIKGTKVLLINGNWINIEDVKVGDMIYQMDMNSKESTFVPVLKTSHTTRDEIFEYSGKDFNQHVSPNHRMIIDINDTVEEEKADKLDISTEFSFIKSYGIKPGNLTVLSSDQKLLAIKCAEENISLSWIKELYNDISSEWAQEFLELYLKYKV